MLLSIIQSDRYAKSSRADDGFTLIELMITITILAILAAIVIPSYNAQVRKSKRSDAITSLNMAAQDLERCRSDFLAYDNANCTNYTVGLASNQKFYTISSTVQLPQAFTLQAAPAANSSQTNDTNCALFTLDHTGQRTAQNSAGTTSAEITAECWRQ